MKHRFVAVVAIALAMLFVQAPAPAAESSDRLILYFRAVPPDARPERFFCAIASQVLDYDGDYPPTGMMTDVGQRYGVTEIYRAKLIDQTNSRLQPSSSADGAYVLTIDPLFTVCARSYAAKTIRGKPAVGYVDLRDGNSYDFVLRGTKSFDVYRVEVAGENVLKDLWTEWKKSH
jgi:hypothetical protein